MDANTSFVDALTGTELPLTQPRTMVCAQAPGVPFIIAITTTNRFELIGLLRRLGFDPDTCVLGTQPFGGADFQVDWDRNVHVDRQAK